MELEKNYPWMKKIKLPQYRLEEWENQDDNGSLTLWSLKKGFIDKREYVQWAVDYYQIPLVKDIFFEKNVMTKERWDEVKEMYNWTEEIFPIAIWDKVLFLGCVEPPLKEVKVSGFETRLVLVSYQSLRNRWNFIQKFLNQKKQTVFKEKTLNTGYKLNSSDSLPQKKTNLKLVKSEAPSAVKSSFQPDLPIEKQKAPLKVLPNLETKESLKAYPEPLENERVQNPNLDSLSPPQEDHPLLMKKINPEKKELSKIPKKISEKKPEKKPEKQKYSENLTSSSTFFSILHSKNEYDDLWKHTQNYYTASLILEVQENGDVSFVSWTGRVNLADSPVLFNLNEGPSLFKIVQKGLPYNGYVVDNAFHKKFFSHIGWPEYPKHLTALPIKDSAHALKQIFIGLSATKALSQSEIKQVESQISKFFREKGSELMAA